MKFKSISIFLFLIDLVFGEQGSLSVKENLLRLKTCGRFGKKEYPHPWLWTVGLRGGNLTYFGTFISSRHFLTSSILFLQHTQPESLKESKCVGNETGITIPGDFEFNITQQSSQRFVISNRIIFPEFCTGHVQHVIKNQFSTMIVEFPEKQISIFPCLDSANPDPAEYWFFKGDIRRKIIPFEINDMFPELYTSEKQQSISGDKQKEIGGVLEQEIDGKVTVIGVKTAGDETNYGQDVIYRMEWLEESFCKSVGICKEDPQSSMDSSTTSASMKSSEQPEAPETSETSSGSSEASEAPETTSPIPDPPETSALDPIPTPEATTIPPPAPAPSHQRTMPPEYIDNGDYDMIFDSLYEFPEFREIEETPYEKKGCRKGFELFSGFLLIILALNMQ